MNHIKLVYWHTDTNNYGDLLSPYIVGKLSGRNIIHKNYFVGNFKSHAYNILTSLKRLDLGFKSKYQFPFERTLVAIGSILHTGNKRSRIWGAGFMRETDKCNGGTIFALRGKLSYNAIIAQIEQGRDIKIVSNLAFGDPALLLPLIIEPKLTKEHPVGLIPHFSEFEYFKKKYGNRFHIIDLRSTNIQKVTEDIMSCERIFSSSLHGIIVAHSYGIPALWVEYNELEQGSDGFKFKDYFSGMDIEEYEPIHNIDEVLDSEESIELCFKTRKHFAIPNKDITLVQNQLISCAPFKLLNQYEK